MSIKIINSIIIILYYYYHFLDYINLKFFDFWKIFEKMINKYESIKFYINNDRYLYITELKVIIILYIFYIYLFK